jgi:5-methylphenazine-1-carboxylate 1-monooxygenase
MNIVIIGAGIGGLALALRLHEIGLRPTLFEAAPQLAEVGVGITVLPHAMQQLKELGVHLDVIADGITNANSVFFNRWGQRIFEEPRGQFAGYDLPEVGVHRGRLHSALLRAVVTRMGANVLRLGARLARIEQTSTSVNLGFECSDGSHFNQQADLVIGCDGVNSRVRKQFYPNEPLAFAGINTWRGLSWHKPILGGASYLRIGTIQTGKMVIYPICNHPSEPGLQLINWVAEIQHPQMEKNDWNKPGQLDDFLPWFQDWRFDWLDVPDLIGSATSIFEYPMVDRDPVAHWGELDITLLGDAAHPMYPRGSNGSAQAMLDAKALAYALSQATSDAQTSGGLSIAQRRNALIAYQQQRLPLANKVVLTNRSTPPDFIIQKADELSGGQPFKNLDELISQAELQAISDRYKAIAGFAQPAAR